MQYRDCVDTQKGRNPCLTALSEYLTQSALPRKCRLVALDFFEGTELPSCSELDTSELNTRLQCNNQIFNISGTENSHLGQLLLIEDISPELIETLGSRLDIDPWFFASYIHRSWRSTRFNTPQNCLLPSREKLQNFLPLYYHKCLSFTSAKPQRRGFLRDTNQHRKVVVIQSTGPSIGLAQHDCAVLLKELGSSWIGEDEKTTHYFTLIGSGVILVDPPITDKYRLSDKAGTSASLPSEPFLGGPEDFGTSGNGNYLKSSQETLRHRGMLNELVYHWTRGMPTMFDPSRPTLQALSYYPLKIVAAEWVNYVAVMSFALKHNDASDMAGDLQAELDKLSSSISELQGWRRRVLTSMEKIRQVIRYVQLPESSSSCSEDWQALRDDYDYISTNIQEHANRLESIIPVVASFIQLIESRRALWETANVTRLTVLAIVFVPLSFIATLFSMSENFGPGGSKFWMYFAVALPITLLVLVLARALGSDWRPPRWLGQLRFAGEKFRPA